MKSNRELKKQALSALKGNWVKALLAVLIFALIESVAVGPVTYQTAVMQQHVQARMMYVGGNNVLHQMAVVMQDPAILEAQAKTNQASSFMSLLMILIIMPLSVGAANAFHKLLVAGDNNLTSNMFSMALGNYWHKVWGMLLVGIFISLWSLLFVIPGIIKAFSYSMTPYILEENPELSANEAIDRSRAMMRGHKFDLFWLYLSFIGWAILCLFTAGIGFLWLAPYVTTTQAAFYEEVKADYALNGGLI